MRHACVLGAALILTACAGAQRTGEGAASAARDETTTPLRSPPGTAALPQVSEDAPERPRVAAPYEVVELSVASTKGAVWAVVDGGTRVRGFQSGEAWRVRFTLRRPGTYPYAVFDEEGELRRGTVTVTGAPRGRGFVVRSTVSPHLLAYEDGTPFRMLGENRINIYDPAWNYLRLSADAYLERMADAGMTTLRLFIFNDCTPQVGCLEPRLGEYDEGFARELDGIYEAAARHGIGVILSVFAIGFTPGDVWKGWEQNPYSRAMGGPAGSNHDFFYDDTARAFARRRFEYIAARYAAYPSFLAVDLLNEPEWDGNIEEEAWIPWAQAMAAAWRAADPYGRLVTAGPVGYHWNVSGDETPWFQSEGCDVVQWHRYGKDIHEVHALAADLTARVKGTWSFQKPILLGEFGYGGEERILFDHTHVGLWATVFSGAGVLAHSAPTFTLDSDARMTPARAARFRILADFLDRFAKHSFLLPTEGVRATRGVQTWALRGTQDEVRLVWLLGPKRGYGRPLSGVEVTFENLPPGRYEISWLEDSSGEPLLPPKGTPGGDGDAAQDTFLLEVPTGSLTLRAPEFSRHLALALRRR